MSHSKGPNMRSQANANVFRNVSLNFTSTF